MAEIATIISFCSNDARFLKKLVAGVRTVSAQILIPVCDHFYDGTPENYTLLEHLYAAFPTCTFLEFPFDPSCSVQMLHSLSRQVAYGFLEESIDEVLFLDVDEIPEENRLQQWLQQFERAPYTACRFASYWYFREAHCRACTWQDSALLVKRRDLDPEWIFNIHERKGMFLRMAGEKLSQVVGLDGLPLFHHYSWVRTKEELLKKTKTWGHREEMDWTRLIEQEFSRELSSTSDYLTVTPYFDPLAEAIAPLEPALCLEEHQLRIAQFPNVKRLTAWDILTERGRK